MADHPSSDDEMRPFDAGSVHEETIELDHASVNGTINGSIDKPKLSPRSIWFTIILIYTITLSDGIASELVALFLPDMCQHRFGIPEDKLGSYVGVLSGAISFANFLSSFVIGHISDTKGRKIVVLIGIGSVCLNTFLLGIAPTFTFALATRLLLGLTNGNTPVVKASLADITTGPTRALAFAYLGATWSLSRAMSNMVSGFTTGIVFESNIAIFNNNAYLVPCLIGAGATFIVFCMSICFYPETLHLGKEAYKKELIEKYGIVPEKAVKHDSNPVKDIFLGIKIILTDPLMRKLFIIFCTNSFANGGILVAMVLFYYLPVEYHGLGFTTMEVGIAFSIFGAASFIFQVGFFKRMLNKFGLYRNYSIGTILFFFSAISIPFANVFFWILGDTMLAKVLTFLYLTLSSSVTAIAFMLGLSVMGVMISNAADPERQGLTQGACASFSALVRAFGPVVSGFIFTFSVGLKFPHLLFFFLAVLYAICFILHRTISNEDRVIVEPKKEHGRIPEDEKKLEMREVHSKMSSEDEEQSEAHIRKGLYSNHNSKEKLLNYSSSELPKKGKCLFNY